MQKIIKKVTNQLPRSLINRYIAIGLIFALGSIVFFATNNFQSAIFGSLILFALFYPLNNMLVTRYNLNSTLAAIIVILISIVAVLVPLITVLIVLINGVISIISDNLTTLNDLSANLPDNPFFDTELYNGYTINDGLANINLDFGALANNLANFLQNLLSGTAKTVGNLFLQLTIMFFILFYLLKDYKRLGKVAVKYSPFTKKNTLEIFNEFKSQTNANILGSATTSLAQGIILGFGFWIFGIEEALFWGFVGFVVAFIPVIGPILVWLPASIILLLNGNLFGAIGIFIWGSVLVSFSDNVVRIGTNKRIADIHPLISLIGIFIGIPVFGILGIVLGPALLSLFLMFIKIFYEEYIEEDIK